MALSGPKAAEGSEIKTAAMREMERLAALRTYTHALSASASPAAC